ncbi:MAG: phosphatidylserine decarboxylase family protein [Desulfatiglandaceae bacterium]|jgi:phosphatidylserine decarboxylase
MDESRINNKWPVAKEGFPFLFIGCVLTFLFSYLGILFLSALMAFATLFAGFFFRDPDRKNFVSEKAVVAPADGKILEVRHLEDSKNPLGQPAIKVSVFMTVFNVHVNRIPVASVINEITYNPGKFFSANLDKASKYNENNRITLETHDAHKVVFIQIAGLIARRIACWVKAGDRVVAGQRFGLIRFGSRVEVYLPDDTQITAHMNQKVRAGQTIIGYLS